MEILREMVDDVPRVKEYKYLPVSSPNAPEFR